MYVVSLCPIAKIFQDRLQRELIKDPDRIFKKESFDISVPTSSVVLAFKSGIPKQIASPKGREQDQEIQSIINWLTGGKEGMECRETDHTGLVILPIGLDVMGALTGLIGSAFEEDEDAKGDKAEKKAAKLAKEIKAEYQKAMDEARALSEQRVMRAVRTTHHNIKMQIEYNKQQGGASYTPSAVEFLCSYVLNDEESRKSEDIKKVTEQFSKMMETIRFK